MTYLVNSWYNEWQFTYNDDPVRLKYSFGQPSNVSTYALLVSLISQNGCNSPFYSIISMLCEIHKPLFFHLYGCIMHFNIMNQFCHTKREGISPMITPYQSVICKYLHCIEHVLKWLSQMVRMLKIICICYISKSIIHSIEHYTCHYLAPGGGCQVLFSPCLSVCLCVCVCVSVCPANILVFFFSAITRDIDLKFIQDNYRFVLNSLKKLTFICQRSRSQGRYIAFWRYSHITKTET